MSFKLAEDTLKESKGDLICRSFNYLTKIISWRHGVYATVCSNSAVSCGYSIFDRSFKVKAGSTDAFLHG